MKTSYMIALSALLAACNQASSADSGLDADTGAAARLFVEPLRVAEEPAERTFEGFEDIALPVLTISTDSGGDGVIDRVVQWTYDDRGNRILLEEDRDGDGEFEIVTWNEHIYDRDDRLIRIESDDGMDGTIDAVETRSYNDAGRAVQIVHDLDNDGTPDKVERNTWNARNLRTQWEIDQPVGGVVETVQTWSFEDGRSDARTLRRIIGQNETLTRYLNVYDEDGRLTVNEVDRDADGTIDSRSLRFYAESGRMVETQVDTDNDGQPDNATIYGYDEDGRLRTISIDNGMDGVSNTVIYRDYTNFTQRQDCLTK